MSLLTSDNLKGLSYAINGEPFINCASKSSVNLKALIYALNGEPLIGASYPLNAGAFFLIF